MSTGRTAYRTCPLCEATCGLELSIGEDEVITGIRGDREDVFSHGFVCPKGASLKALHEDPDRLTSPMVRGADGTLRTATWDEAFAVVAERLPAVLDGAGGRDAVAVYLGNPSAHSLAALLYGRVLVKALGTKSVYSASTVDQMPKHVSAGHMFGAPTSIPVPDLDRTDFLLVLGANPFVSNGSLLTAPDMRGRMRALQARGGRFVVVDPRRTRTAAEADRWLAITPGTDALLLFGIVHELFAAGLATPHERAAGVDELRELAAAFTPEAVAGPTGIAADDIRWLARELAGAPRAAVYGRIGTCTQEFGTLASWLVDVVNVLTGNLDREGGAMFASPAARPPASKRQMRFGRWQSRVRSAPEAMGELPAACLTEEIATPGDGRVRALITVAGNPVLSTPDGAALSEALDTLDLMVCVDFYLNETTRHADVILPPPSPLSRGHYDIALYGFAARNVANYSPPVFPVPEGAPDEWEILLRLTGIASGVEDVAGLDDFVAGDLARRCGVAYEGARRGPERLLDIMLQSGPYELSLDALEAAPHGIDLGPLQPRLDEVLTTDSGRIELAPAALVADAERLRASLTRTGSPDSLVLVGRRHLRSNNSWMHNLPILVRGPERCTLQLHPDDATRLGLADGALATVTSATGKISLPAEVTDTIRAGVVSVPHGWGHDAPGASLSVAATRPGANVNLLVSRELLDPLSGNAVLNGVPVEVAPA